MKELTPLQVQVLDEVPFAALEAEMMKRRAEAVALVPCYAEVTESPDGARGLVFRDGGGVVGALPLPGQQSAG